MSYPKDFLKALPPEGKKEIEEENLRSVEAACNKLFTEVTTYREALTQSKETSLAAERVAHAINGLEKIDIAFRTTCYWLGRHL